ncbi:helix-turn-helix transcriptional regulator [Paenibacillus sp. SZ31]|uniref:helix-turn-helix domain-containing protein n=1 Tax=Paenibacillus sp. SZ31 TaxID=2725555 RepID=UPI001469EB94|nr:helix-turn-helix transcriptional regulator [Paenibacillus sp. SZ31]NMI04831.1 helix-turn-helix transcriptional regulator [Paenibacillus sp. SZ31]
MNTLGERVKKLRNEQNLSMEALANRLQVATYDNETGEFVSFKKSKSATISNIENNKNRPSVDLALAIADYFKVSIEWLIRGDIEQSKGIELISAYRELTAEEEKELPNLLRHDKEITAAALRLVKTHMDSLMKDITISFKESLRNNIKKDSE